ncbi:MAG: carbohydrate-binding domain-containing protein [Prevotella sp.]|jgi:hypothetical protein|nr:carbohydrate-binding domain-containing protein [Prevotella sp.]MCI1282393.1 carbohydrate-binding domain-containing protein [Prevotella sp.]
MKRFTLFLIVLLSAIGIDAQTLNVVVGSVTYQVPAAQAGDMVYSDGTFLTILNKKFTLSAVDSMYIDNSTVTDNAIKVSYNGTSASVKVAGNCMQYLNEVKVSGANVTVVQGSALAQELSYTLTGTSTNGSFYMDGEYKATVVLNNLTLTCTDSAAVNIENGKRIAVDIEGTNSLADASSSAGKAAFVVNGHSEFTGSGSLSLTGNKKHAFFGDEYVFLKKTFTGSITVESSVKDGFSINQYFKMNNGTVTIKAPGDDGIQVETTGESGDEDNGQVIINGGTLNITVPTADTKGIKCDSLMTITGGSINIACTSTATAAKALKSGTDMNISGGTFTISTAGSGLWDSDESATSACAALKSDGNMNISGGTLTLTATGKGGKGISCEGALTISDAAAITISTSGNIYVNINGTEYSNYSNVDNLADAYKSSAKGIKAEGNVNISGGTVNVTTTGTNAEGIESKAILTISGGEIVVSSYDDAINSSSHMYITGGSVYVSSSNNDGLDSNGNMYIQGGVIVAYGTTSPECGIDANEEENYTVYFTGGTLVGIGGGNSHPTNSSSTQGYVTYSGSITNGNTMLLRSGSTNVMAFTMGRTYSGSGGGGGMGPGQGGGSGSTSFIITTPNVSSSSSYTLYTAATVSGTAWHGLYTKDNITAVSSTGSSSSSVTGKQYSN